MQYFLMYQNSRGDLRQTEFPANSDDEAIAKVKRVGDGDHGIIYYFACGDFIAGTLRLSKEIWSQQK